MKRGKKIRRKIGSAVVKWVISPDNKALVGSDRSDEATLNVWDVMTGDKLRTLDNRYAIRVKQLAFSPDGKLLAGSGTDGIKIWDFETGEQIQRVEKYKNVSFHQHLDWIHSLVFSPNNKSILSTGGDGLIQFWDIETGQHIGTIEKNVFRIALSKDAKTLVGLGENQTVHMWRVP